MEGEQVIGSGELVSNRACSGSGGGGRPEQECNPWVRIENWFTTNRKYKSPFFASRTLPLNICEDLEEIERHGLVSCNMTYPSRAMQSEVRKTDAYIESNLTDLSLRWMNLLRYIELFQVAHLPLR
jgi:hypothetical protein